MNHSTEVGAQGICPTGWHVPSDADWSELIVHLGGEDVAGGKLKASGTEFWKTPNVGATNASGFNGLPAGAYNPLGKYFADLGIGGYFWSSTEKGSNAGLFTLDHQYESITLLTEPKTIVASIRCVMD